MTDRSRSVNTRWVFKGRNREADGRHRSSDLSTEVFVIPSESVQGMPCSSKKYIIQMMGVCQIDLIKSMRYGENQVVVWAR